MPSFASGRQSRGVKSITFMMCTKYRRIHLIRRCFFLRLFIACQAWIMGQAEELYFALIDVGYTARRCKIPAVSLLEIGLTVGIPGATRRWRSA